MSGLNNNQQKIYDQITGAAEVLCLIHGAHGVGKTFLLKELERYYQEHGEKVIFIDAQAFAVDPNSLWHFLAEEFEIEVEKLDISGIVSQIARKIKAESRNLILIIDELRAMEVRTQVFFRAMAQASECGLIVASDKHPGEIEDSDSCGSPLYNMLESFRLVF